MRMTSYVLVLAFLSLSLTDCTSRHALQTEEPMVVDLGLVPKPLQVEKSEGSYTLTPGTKIVFEGGNADVKAVAVYLQEQLGRSTGLPLSHQEGLGSPTPQNTIVLALAPGTGRSGSDAGSSGPDGGRTGPIGSYELRVSGSGVRITADSPVGLFYGVQTLCQLLPPEAYSRGAAPGVTWTVPAIAIKDRPRFSWRGTMLDVSRHFFPKSFVKECIDMAAMHKLNTFHWHLTDDQGWRIQIRKYPKLTSVGAWRVDREQLTWNERKPAQPGEVATYGGFYTQDDVREVVAYARSRFVTVVPEIEMPGHATAALAGYPELSCTGGPFTVRTGGYWPITDIFCAGNDSTFEFLQNVLTEVIELFPGEVIHIGGDEANKAEWKKCPKCQARIKNEGLKNEEELQSYFIRRIEKFLNAKGKRLIGWDEILEGGLAPNATVMSWRGIEGGIAAARENHDVVMTPTDYCYFDYYQAKSGEPEAIGGFVPLEKVYSFEPVPEALTPEEAKHILGAQANLWTEYIGERRHAEYMYLPRLAALAEVDWSPPEQKDYEGFLARLSKQYQRYDAAGLNYRKHRPAPAPAGESSPTGEQEKADAKTSGTR